MINRINLIDPLVLSSFAGIVYILVAIILIQRGKRHCHALELSGNSLKTEQFKRIYCALVSGFFTFGVVLLTLSALLALVS